MVEFFNFLWLAFFKMTDELEWIASMFIHYEDMDTHTYTYTHTHTLFKDGILRLRGLMPNTGLAGCLAESEHHSVFIPVDQF